MYRKEAKNRQERREKSTGKTRKINRKEAKNLQERREKFTGKTRKINRKEAKNLQERREKFTGKTQKNLQERREVLTRKLKPVLLVRYRSRTVNVSGSGTSRHKRTSGSNENDPVSKYFLTLAFTLK